MSTLSQFFPPAPRFSVDDIPDLTGRIVVITGGYTGIGKETVKALLKHNATVYIAGRSQMKADAALAELRLETGKGARFVELDLADLESIKKGAENFLSQENELHILFNNAGVMEPPIDETTRDGYDLQFGTNVLGHFYLTKLLLPTLISTTSRVSSGPVGRVVNTASFGHTLTPVDLDFEAYKDGPKRRATGVDELYYQSKFGNVVLSTELARRYGGRGIISTSLNPGNLKTELGRHLRLAKRIAAKLITYPPPLGALTQLYAGTSSEGADLNGKYLIPWARVGTPRPETQDPEIGRKLWDWLERQVEMDTHE